MHQLPLDDLLSLDIPNGSYIGTEILLPEKCWTSLKKNANSNYLLHGNHFMFENNGNYFLKLLPE